MRIFPFISDNSNHTLSHKIPLFRFLFFHSGMEIWNPADRTVSTIVDKMPVEITTAQKMNKFSMIAIKNNTEILTIGGWSNSYLSGLDNL